MPGDMLLSCLLGAYDKAQSFDVTSGTWGVTNINSWNKSSTQSSMSPIASEAHSSAQTLNLDINSENIVTLGVLVRYQHGVANDLYARWFPDITTHDLRLQGWGRTTSTATSGNMSVLLRGTYSDTYWPVPFAAGGTGPANLSFFARTTLTISANGVEGAVDLVRTAGQAGGAEVHLFDTMLPQVDWITLTPEFDFIEESRLPAARHRTQGGVLHTYQWTRHWAWRVPLRFLSNSHADLINWWWVNGFALAFTLDTSDQNTVYTAKIVNETQPIGSKIKPYALNAGGWAGVLELESLDQGSLVF